MVQSLSFIAAYVMEQLSLKTRIELVQLYYQNGSSSAAALRRYKTQHGLLHDPFSVRTVQNLIRKFEEHGVVVDLPRSGRPSVTQEVVEEVVATLEQGQSSSSLGICSAHSVSRTTGIPNSTVLKVLKKSQRLHPYHISLHQELKETDYAARLEFANWFLEQTDIDETFDRRVLWTDEAHFSLDGTLCTKNCIIWSSENPHVSVTRSLHPDRVTVWCGFSSDFILPPFFLESNETVNSDRYLNILKHHMLPNLGRRKRNIIFMQDGAAPHTAVKVREFLHDNFGERVISRNFPWGWPARSPDLNPCDFFLWGYIKSRVFLRHPTTIPELKNAISAEISALSHDILSLTVSSLFDRLLCVLSSKGGHIE
jgi:transposase